MELYYQIALGIVAYLCVGMLVTYRFFKEFTTYSSHLDLEDIVFACVVIVFWVIVIAAASELFIPNFGIAEKFRKLKDIQIKNPFYKGN